MAEKQTEFVDGLFQFDLGINSDIAPLLLPKNQLSFLINGTVRGTFVTDRPPFRKIILDFGGDDELAAAVTKGLFQATTSYSPDFGSGSLMAAISGRLFEFPIDQSGTTAVVERTIPGDPNPPGVTQAWMWQFEKWIIWNDGQSLPVFFDGQTSRRSFGPSVSLGTVFVNFTAPAVNGTVTITLSQPYTGQVDVPIFIGVALYQVKAQVSGYEVTLENVSDTGSTLPQGAPVYVEPGFITTTAAPFIVPGHGNNVIINLSKAVTLAASEKLIIDSIQYSVVNAVTASSTVKIKNVTSGSPHGQTIPTGTEVRKAATAAPNFLVGQLVQAYPTPAIGGTVVVNLTNPYTGPVDQPVVINGAQYVVTAISPPAGPSATIIVQNITDTPGNIEVATTPVATVPELPPGRMGAYGMCRNVMSLVDGKSFLYSDIVGGSSGTPAFNFRDAPMRVTENTFLLGGGNFVVPGNLGDIRAMVFAATLDQSLGQGPLQIYTPGGVFSCIVPVDRLVWQSITNPILTQSLIANGGLGQDSTIPVNGDTFFRAFNGFYSLRLARTDFQVGWGNTPLSVEENRVLINDDVSLLGYGSSIYFDNREISTANPQTSAAGVFHPATIALNCDPVSSIRGKAPPVWEGLWTGLNVLKYVKGIFGGMERAFAFSYNVTSLEIELYEILPTGDAHFDNDTVPITWELESGSVFKDIKGKTLYDLITLMDGEIYVDDVIGNVTFEAFYKPDQYPCWIPWHKWSVCGKVSNPLAITPPDLNEKPQYKTRMGLGEPNVKDCDPLQDRPFRDGYTFQFKLKVTGHCRFLGAKFRAVAAPQPKFAKPICDPICET